MDELVNLVSQKTGITQDQARMAVSTVLGFVKQRLPAALASQIDALVNAPAGSPANLGSIEGMLGKKP
jgi:hypothetical protein